jgi:hypothetical protein
MPAGIDEDGIKTGGVEEAAFNFFKLWADGMVTVPHTLIKYGMEEMRCRGIKSEGAAVLRHPARRHNGERGIAAPLWFAGYPWAAKDARAHRIAG